MNPLLVLWIRVVFAGPMFGDRRKRSSSPVEPDAATDDDETPTMPADRWDEVLTTAEREAEPALDEPARTEASDDDARIIAVVRNEIDTRSKKLLNGVQNLYNQIGGALRDNRAELGTDQQRSQESLPARQAEMLNEVASKVPTAPPPTLQEIREEVTAALSSELATAVTDSLTKVAAEQRQAQEALVARAQEMAAERAEAEQRLAEAQLESSQAVARVAAEVEAARDHSVEESRRVLEELKAAVHDDIATLTGELQQFRARLAAAIAVAERQFGEFRDGLDARLSELGAAVDRTGARQEQLDAAVAAIRKDLAALARQEATGRSSAPQKAAGAPSGAKKAATRATAAKKAATEGAVKKAATEGAAKKPAATEGAAKKPAATEGAAKKQAATEDEAKKPAATEGAAKKPAARPPRASASPGPPAP